MMHWRLGYGRAWMIALTLSAVTLICVGCAATASPKWTPAAVGGHTVVWSLAGTTARPDVTLNRPSDRKLRPGPVLARVSCDVESVLYLTLVNRASEPADQPVPVQPSGKLVCGPWSARFTVLLDGEAAGGEDLLLVFSRAGASGRDVVSYSIEILQPRQV